MGISARLTERDSHRRGVFITDPSLATNSHKLPDAHEYFHCSKTGEGPLIRFRLKLTLTSTRFAILSFLVTPRM